MIHDIEAWFYLRIMILKQSQLRLAEHQNIVFSAVMNSEGMFGGVGTIYK